MCKDIGWSRVIERLPDDGTRIPDRSIQFSRSFRWIYLQMLENSR